MATFNSLSAFQKALSSPQMQNSIANQNAGIITKAQAYPKIYRWLLRTKRKLHDNMASKDQYIHGFGCTGQYLSHIQTTGIIDTGTSLHATVYVTPDMHESIFRYTSVDVTILLEEGYKVHQDVWFKDIPNFGERKGGHAIQKTLSEVVGPAAADGVTIS